MLLCRNEANFVDVLFPCWEWNSDHAVPEVIWFPPDFPKTSNRLISKNCRSNCVVSMISVAFDSPIQVSLPETAFRKLFEVHHIYSEFGGWLAAIFFHGPSDIIDLIRANRFQLLPRVNVQSVVSRWFHKNAPRQFWSQMWCAYPANAGYEIKHAIVISS